MKSERVCIRFSGAKFREYNFAELILPRRVASVWFGYGATTGDDDGDGK